jgi:hypothetical protein
LDSLLFESLSPFAVQFAGIGVLTAANFAANHAVSRPLPRLVYTIFIVFLAGTVIPAIALGVLLAHGLLKSQTLGLAPGALVAALGLGTLFLLGSVWREDAAQWRRIPRLLIALFAPSLAEVLVFLGLVFTGAHALLVPWTGPLLGGAGAAAVTSAAFALYHLTHAAPWNAWRTVKILLVVWLAIALFYAFTANLWAAALLNTLMATVGFVKNRVTRPEEQPVAISALLDVAAICSVLWICGIWL